MFDSSKRFIEVSPQDLVYLTLLTMLQSRSANLRREFLPTFHALWDQRDPIVIDILPRLIEQIKEAKKHLDPQFVGLWDNIVNRYDQELIEAHQV